MSSRSPLNAAGLVAIGLAIGGCVASGGDPPAAGAETFNDPLEETNRAIFSFNQAVDANVLVPAAKTYRTVLPPPVQESLHDFLSNLNAPIIFANDVLQAEFGLAATTLGRMAINTTIGFGGMFDVATRLGMPYHTNDLGITFATWGIGEGPYIVMPVLGPSNPRDIIGEIGDSYADPGNYIAGQYGYTWTAVVRAAVEGIDQRSRNIENLADIERTSLDFYATIRSLYRQRRASQIRHEQGNLPNPAPVQGSNRKLPHAPYSAAKKPASMRF